MRGCSRWRHAWLLWGGMHGCSGGRAWFYSGDMHGFIWGGMHGFIRGVCGFIRGACMVLFGGACMVLFGGACVVLFGGTCMVLLGGLRGFIRGACMVLFGGACVVFSVFSDTMRYGQWAGGTHPTGMHSCLNCKKTRDFDSECKQFPVGQSATLFFLKHPNTLINLLLNRIRRGRLCRVH